jgi:hypothetical protein
VIWPPPFGGHGEGTKTPRRGLRFLKADFAHQKSATVWEPLRFLMMEDGGWKMEDGRWKMEDG